MVQKLDLEDLFLLKDKISQIERQRNQDLMIATVFDLNFYLTAKPFAVDCS